MTVRELNALRYGDLVRNTVTNEIRTVKQTFADAAHLDGVIGQRTGFTGQLVPANCADWEKVN